MNDRADEVCYRHADTPLVQPLYQVVAPVGSALVSSHV